MNKSKIGIFENKSIFYVILVAQIICAIFFVTDVIFDFREDWSNPHARLHMFVESIAALALVFSVAFEWVVWRYVTAHNARLERSVKFARQEIYDTITYYFEQWQLTPAEFEVAMLSVKGFSIAEIAGIRGASEGTIKSQLNAIYRKSGSQNRSELLSVVIDALVADGQ